MSWLTILKVTHLIISIMLITSILLQLPEKGLAGLFGGGGEVYHKKRGAERVIFILTIVLAILFSITSTLNFFLA